MADKPNLPKTLILRRGFPCYNVVHKMGAREGDRVILVNASEIAEQMRTVRKGKLTTITQICRTIARKHRVKACCTLTAGIFIMTIANALEEIKKEGKKDGTAYWRTLKADGSLNEKYPGGTKAQKRLLEKEGHKVIRKGKRYFVEDYERYL
jgi:hypothetical protein